MQFGGSLNRGVTTKQSPARACGRRGQRHPLPERSCPGASRSERSGWTPRCSRRYRTDRWCSPSPSGSAARCASPAEGSPTPTRRRLRRQRPRHVLFSARLNFVSRCGRAAAPPRRCRFRHQVECRLLPARRTDRSWPIVEADGERKTAPRRLSAPDWCKLPGMPSPPVSAPIER